MQYVRAAVSAVIVAAAVAPCQAQPAQRYNIQADSVSVSGISSGADLAHQLHIAHSSKIHGVGLLAASPYHCAKGDVDKALQYCSRTGADFGQPYNGPPSPTMWNPSWRRQRPHSMRGKLTTLQVSEPPRSIS